MDRKENKKSGTMKVRGRKQQNAESARERETERESERGRER